MDVKIIVNMEDEVTVDLSQNENVKVNPEPVKTSGDEVKPEEEWLHLRLVSEGDCNSTYLVDQFGRRVADVMSVNWTVTATNLPTVTVELLATPTFITSPIPERFEAGVSTASVGSMVIDQFLYSKNPENIPDNSK